MKNIQEIKDLAKSRLGEAKTLFEAGYYDGAFYLAGYAVELTLKAKICTLFEIENLFAIEPVDKESNWEGVKKLREVTHTHSLHTLLLLSGLRKKFDEQKALDRTLFETNSLLFSKWGPDTRYKACGTMETKCIERIVAYYRRTNQMDRKELERELSKFCEVCQKQGVSIDIEGLSEAYPGINDTSFTVHIRADSWANEMGCSEILDRLVPLLFSTVSLEGRKKIFSLDVYNAQGSKNCHHYDTFVEFSQDCHAA